LQYVPKKSEMRFNPRSVEAFIKLRTYAAMFLLQESTHQVNQISHHVG